MEKLVKKLPPNGYWKICNVHTGSGMGKYIATYERVVGREYEKYSVYGDTMKETLQKLIAEVLTKGDNFSSKK